jgi:hypothetical protein
VTAATIVVLRTNGGTSTKAQVEPMAQS